METLTKEIVLKANRFTRDKEGHFTMLNVLIHQKVITMLNFWAHNKFSKL